MPISQATLLSIITLSGRMADLIASLAATPLFPAAGRSTEQHLTDLHSHIRSNNAQAAELMERIISTALDDDRLTEEEQIIIRQHTLPF